MFSRFSLLVWGTLVCIMPKWGPLLWQLATTGKVDLASITFSEPFFFTCASVGFTMIVYGVAPDVRRLMKDHWDL